MDRDPDCVRNLAADPSHAETKKSLRVELDMRLRQDVIRGAGTGLGLRHVQVHGPAPACLLDLARTART